MPLARISPLVVVLVMSLVVTARAGAQPVATFAELPLHLEEGDRVMIVCADGHERTGWIKALDPAAIDVDMDGRIVRCNAGDVREVRAPDGFKNGVLLGLAVGTAAGVIAGFMVTTPGDPVTPAVIILTSAAGGGAGVGIGITLDALKRHYRTLYRVPPSTVVRMSPVVAPGRGYGAIVSVSW